MRQKTRIMLCPYPYPATVPGYVSKWPMPTQAVALRWARVSGIRGRIWIEREHQPANRAK